MSSDNLHKYAKNPKIFIKYTLFIHKIKSFLDKHAKGLPDAVLSFYLQNLNEVRMQGS